MAAPAVVGTPTTFSASTSADTIVLTKPAGVQDGDMLVAVLRTMGSTSPSDFVLAGWTRRGYAFIPNDASGRVTGVFTHPVTNAASEPASYTFQKSVADARRVGVMFTVRGVDLTNPIVGQSPTWSVTDTTITIPPYTLDSSADALEVYAWGTEVVSPNSATPTSNPGGELALVTSSAGTGATRSTAWVGSRTVASSTGGSVNLTWTTVSGSAATAVTLRGITAVPPVTATGVVGLVGDAGRALGVVRGSAGALSLNGSASTTVAVARAADGAVSVEGTATAVNGVTGDALGVVALTGAAEGSPGVQSDAIGQIDLQGSGVLPGPQAPTTRTLTGVTVTHTLTGTTPRRTLEAP